MANAARTTQTSKPGGRPRVAKAAARSEVVRARVSIAERGRIEAAAAQAGMRTSDYIRLRVLGEMPASPPARSHGTDPAVISLLNRLVLEAARIGNNANQLARATHRGSAFQEFWREIGYEVKATTDQARAVLAKVLDE
ncbi:MAG: hypothetical protein AAFR49_10895 [Pseudomonadota bacterium]